ncbi:MAG: hypothetical protein EVJ47_07975 [Candidatus Acidulodesulfobacterium ferriphilum]|jgi:intein-encoded DNA endonuclease-like protein|uniref:Uncharacterized protein n=1 Tax=Candidatus Acidulodesulfobacterium ferriphilum TaxID=2597223 RepID=A0A519BA54_9DELT|nr:MAG: hypothetical protein EVJ47_07975 [Candidatus Acidulodesulfobacterium ferriphilum]
MQRRLSKKRKILTRYKPEILNMKNQGFSLRQISKELMRRHNLKISRNYLSELLNNKSHKLSIVAVSK